MSDMSMESSMGPVFEETNYVKSVEREHNFALVSFFSNYCMVVFF